MVSIIDRFVRGIREFFIPTKPEFPEIRQDIREQRVIETIPPEEGEELETQDFRRKFVSGLFYCGGTRKQFFGLTFEQNSTIRESELLDAIEDATGGTCSQIRDNFGYSDDFVSRVEVRGSAIWPDVEVGEL